MKKTAVVVMLVATMGLSNVAFAGFGLPNILGGKKDNTASTQQAANLDLSGLTTKQTRVINMLRAAYNCTATSNTLLLNALGNNTGANAIMAAQNLLKEKPQDKAALKNLDKAVKENQPKADTFKSIANGTADQKATLKAAMEQASTYKWASYACFGLAINEAAGMIKEAGTDLHSVHDMNTINKLNGIISTGKMASSLYNDTKKIYGAYDTNTSNIKQLLGVQEATADSAAVKEAVNNVTDGF